MEIEKYIDHTLLIPNSTSKDIKKLCEEAIQYKFKAVCVPPFHIHTAASVLDDTLVRVATVVGFPMGYSAIPAKVEEVKRAVNEGVDEIDMVANLAAVKDAKWSHVHNDIDSVTRAAHLKGKTIKVILEMGFLTNDELRKLCDICVRLGVDYVKTSTGMHGHPATLEQIKLLKSIVGNQTKIKAAGGIKSRSAIEQMIAAGASRIGTSSAVSILNATLTK